jgi:hypothetical protein
VYFSEPMFHWVYVINCNLKWHGQNCPVNRVICNKRTKSMHSACLLVSKRSWSVPQHLHSQNASAHVGETDVQMPWPTGMDGDQSDVGGPGMYAGTQACHISPPVASLRELERLRKRSETRRMEELTTKVAVRKWERTRMHQSVGTTKQHSALMVHTVGPTLLITTVTLVCVTAHVHP